MKNTLSITALMAGVLVFGALNASPALAFGEMCDEKKDKKMSPERMERMQEKKQARFTEHMAALEKALALRPEQAQAWAQYHQAHTDHMQAKKAKAGMMMGTPMTETDSAQTPVTAAERMAQKEARAQAHLEHIREMRAHTEQFYAQLDATQQQAFDAHMAERKHGGPR